MNVELTNPSAWHPLRVASQTRSRNVVDKVAATPAPKREHETRAELEKRGSVITMKKTRVSTKFGSEIRECPVPLWQAEGADSLAHWVTEASEHYLRESQQALTPAPRAERVVDQWLTPTPLLSVPPGGKALVNLEEHQRLVISCEEPVTLQLSNTSHSHTLRLRTLNPASGTTEHKAFLAPAREWPSSAIVSADAEHLAVIEKMPS